VDALDIDFGKLFSFDGRVGRKTFWMTVVLLLVAELVIFIPLFALGQIDSLQVVVLLASIVTYLAVGVAGLASTVKRLHDRGKSGWFYFISLIPLVGAIWLIIEVGFKDSQAGINQYGAAGSGSPFRADAAIAYSVSNS
jgi:uncharacterized membrane protein YhaH (DUF805 family)